MPHKHVLEDTRAHLTADLEYRYGIAAQRGQAIHRNRRQIDKEQFTFFSGRTAEISSLASNKSELD